MKRIANLRKSYKLPPKYLHPGNNKQSVPLTTSAAIKSYFPEEIPAARFLNLVNTGLVMLQFSMKKKPEFFTFNSQWQNFSFTGCSRFILSAQTANALQIALNGTADMIEHLLSDGYNYVLINRLQTDPLEKVFWRIKADEWW